jgi:hypothetical protein
LCAVGASAGPRSIQVQLVGPIAVSPGLYLAILALAIAAIVTVAAFRARPATAILLCTVSLAAAVEIASLRILRPIDPLVSARPHAEFMRNDLHPDRIFTYQLNRSWNYGLAFYFQRELPEWPPTDSKPALVLTTKTGLEEIRRLGRVSGEIEQLQPGLIYVPVMPVPAAR